MVPEDDDQTYVFSREREKSSFRAFKQKVST